MSLLRSSLVLALGVFASFATAASGINCEGSGVCSTEGCGRDALAQIRGYVQAALSTNGDLYFKDGRQYTQDTAGDTSYLISQTEDIACQGIVPNTGCCAFFQFTTDAEADQRSLSKAEQLLGFLEDHGCAGCGSVPINYPNDNTIANGALAVNFEDPPGCASGYCGGGGSGPGIPTLVGNGTEV
ncbi:hypothetical protein PRZ48_014515 [Zasmidium cellare]|uniref:Killer toxin Kp4 domain-containing protein n=1 Tax=Zasmidium cellare TaxID=395010 RepID=A0ABR0DYG6_ZASCE|nr:hypothetical protein PRZ48_014515 [Zasmidium cellare]